MTRLLLWLAVGQVGDHELRLSDMPGYREALAPARDAAASSARPVSFHDLWEHAEEHRGRRVRVEGRVVRRFHQEAVGAFPALTELWIVSPSQDPFCLVYPTRENDAATTGATARFEGTFLKLIPYPAGDQGRLTPLIVGPSPPVSFADDPMAGILPATPFGPVDLLVGLGVAGLVLLILLRHGMRSPARALTTLAHDESPRFVDREGE